MAEASGSLPMASVLVAEPDANDDRDFEFNFFLLPAGLTWLGLPSGSLIFTCNVYPLPNLHTFMIYSVDINIY